MILETIMTESTKVSDYDIMWAHPLNPAKWALWAMEDEARKRGRKLMEVACWRDYESMSEVVSVKSKGLERWE